MSRIIELLEPVQPLEASGNIEQNTPAQSEIETTSPSHIDHPESVSSSAKECTQRALLAQYRGVISCRADLLALSKTQLEEITSLFHSTSVFLVRLREI